MPDLESLTDEMDALCAEALGETITYIPSGRAPLRFKAHVYYADGVRDIGAGQMVEQDMMIHVRKLSLPKAPSQADRFTLPRRAGKTYYPGTVTTDDSGMHWVIVPKVVK